MTHKRHIRDTFMTYIFLAALMLTPRIYILDWSSTPSEQQENFISSSTDLIIPLDDNNVVFIGDIVEGERLYDER